MMLWRSPDGNTVVDVEQLVGLRVTSSGSGSTKKWSLIAITSARDVELFSDTEATVRKAFAEITSWVAPPP